MGTLKVNNKSITYNNSVIKVDNISSMDILSKDVAPINKIIFLTALFFFAQFIGVFISAPLRLITSDLDMISFISITLTIAIMAVFFFKRHSIKPISKLMDLLNLNKYYYLAIYTNSGKKELFGHTNYDFVNSIRLKIQEAMETESGVNVTYNIDNSTTHINVSGNMVIQNIESYDLRPSEKEYLKEYFEPALERIQKELIDSTNEELKRNFELLKSELNTNKPRKSILDTAWSTIKGSGNFMDLYEVIDKSISFFG